MVLSTLSYTNDSSFAQVAADVLNREAIDIVKSRNFLLDVLMGKRQDGGPAGMPSFQRLERIEGYEKQIRLRVGHPAWTATGKSKAAQLAAVVPAYDETKYGIAKFDLTLYNEPVFIPYWDDKKTGGSLMKGMSVAQEEIESWLDAFYLTLETAINGVDNQTDTTVGSWQYALADGTVMAENTYLNIDRSNAANSNFRGQRQAVAATTDLGEVRQIQNDVIKEGGSAKLGVLGDGNYDILQGLLNSNYTLNAETDPDFMHWVGHYTHIGPTRFGFSKQSSDSKIGVISPEDWRFYMNEQGFSVGGFKRSQIAVAALQTSIDVAVAFVCLNPKKSGVLTGVTS